ncbi:RNA polymerase sigma factor, sigma-70 family [Selenomonas ruminantium]|uniref:RNA polymerase sigma factor, sigma-70 family n=2 Tax=Selenomonas ruminantium TaxID=971 RepID=A0A1M6RXS9_SELRU|nr:RNA polymerase sigma factor, sigma-70 family [Selenomonas ruminantium]
MYQEQEENELICRAQKGDKQACCKLLAAYEGLLRKMSHRYQHTPAGSQLSEDSPGILNLAFMEALKEFDSRRGTHFAAFLQSRLHGAIYKAFRRSLNDRGHTAHPETGTEDNTEWYDAIASPAPTPERYAAARTELAAIFHHLSTAEKRLLSLIYVRGLSLKEIARRLELSPAAISKRKAKLLAHIQAITDMDTACPCT